tara:strand:+ start:147 stop:1376 length:1230 start_codon:yes stop_codon:yes gene_type:complete
MENSNKFIYSKTLKDFILYLSCFNFSKAEEEFKKFTKKDYQKLVLKVIELRLSGIFLKFIKNHDHINLKNEIFFKRLVERHSFIVKKNLLAYKDCLQITERLEDKKIEYRFLKGIPLVLNYYKDINLREIRDIDILIEIKDLSVVLKELEKIGFYASQNPEVKIENLKIDLSRYHDAPELINSNGTRLEIHFKLGNHRPNIEEKIREQILTNLDHSLIGNRKILTSDVNSTFLHLLYHSSIKEFFNPGPLYLTDIHFLKNKLDKELLMKKIKDIGLEKHLKLIISIFNNYSEEKIFFKDELLLDFSKEKKEEISCCENLMMNRELGNEFRSLFLANSLSELLKTSINLLASSKIEHKYLLVSQNNLKWNLRFIKIKEILVILFKLLRLKLSSNIFREIKDLRKIDKLVS